MEKDFVTYEQALALKELGFDEPCWAWWHIEDCDTRFCYSEQRSPIINSRETEIVGLPTFSQAFRWFREKHNLYSEINLDSYKEPYSLKVTIKHLDDTNTFVDKEYYPYSNGIGDIDNKKYEEAELACLDKLIEICRLSK